jgi:hypothetical protein
VSRARAAVQAAKRLLLPQGRRFRRVLWGPAAGRWMMLDLNHELRLYLGVYERELAKSFRELLRPGMKSFDIGGRDGYSALAIAARTGAEVISFECEPAGAAAMQQVFDRNSLPARAVTAFVGAEDSGPDRVTVDRAAHVYFTPDFLKIDVEGAEVDVLRGASLILATRRPPMIVEVHGAEAEAGCLDILAGHRYRVEIIDRSRLLPENRPLAHNRWLVCRPPGS